MHPRPTISIQRMEALSHYRVAYLLTLGFFVLGLGAWGLFVWSGSWVGPLVLLLAVGLWAGLLEASVAQRGKLPHPVGAAGLLLLGPLTLAVADLVGRSVSGEALALSMIVRGVLAFAVAALALALLAHFVTQLVQGLDHLAERT